MERIRWPDKVYSSAINLKPVMRGKGMSTDQDYQDPVDELAQITTWLRSGNKAALATVVRTWGSSPRPVGSHLAVDETGAMVGSVSGGCIEGAVVTEALEIIECSSPSLVLEFGVSDEQAWEVGLSCGGAIHVYIEAAAETTVNQLLKDRENKRSVATVTGLEDGSQALLYQDILQGNVSLNADELAEAQQLLSQSRSGLLQSSQSQIFVRSYVPKARLIIVGAAHIAQCLAPMATVADFEVTVVDPRSAFASQDRFPGVTLSHEWPDDGLEGLQLDAQTAVVTLSHDLKIDDPALEVALRSPAFYIGALGSKRTHAKRVERLTEMGLADQLQRINAPVGLDLGGRAPAEIAVSILAQIIRARYALQPITTAGVSA